MAGRVFIIGAGASREDTKHLEIQMPLANEFFTAKYFEEHWPLVHAGIPQFADSALLKILKQYFGVSPSSVTKRLNSTINVEVVYSFIETGLQVYPSSIQYREIFEQAKRELLRYIIDVIRLVPWRLPKPKLHNAIVSSLRDGDSIITFNWDLLFDNLLAKTQKGRRYLDRQTELLNPFANISGATLNYEDGALQRMHEGVFLKLHGSVNLATCENLTCIHNSVPLRFGLFEEMPEYWSCRACGSRLELMIVPPYVHKSYLTNRFLRLQAGIAAGRLSMADEIVVIGYSMPVFDFQARTLLRIARLEAPDVGQGECYLSRLIVVNPSVSKKSYINQIDEVFGIRQSEQAYGHQVERVIYSTVDEYLKKELPPKRRKK